MRDERSANPPPSPPCVFVRFFPSPPSHPTPPLPSLTQAIRLGCFPKLPVLHTSATVRGQIYVPAVNWVLMILCVAVVAGFQDTVGAGTAYHGAACVFVCLVATSKGEGEPARLQRRSTRCARRAWTTIHDRRGRLFSLSF